MAESNLYFVPRLLAEELKDDSLFPVAHAQGGTSDQRAIAFPELAKALGGVGGEAPAGGVSRAEFDEFKANVIADLNNLRDAICLSNASLDADTGVATDTFAANGDPPPLLTE